MHVFFSAFARQINMELYVLFVVNLSYLMFKPIILDREISFIVHHPKYAVNLHIDIIMIIFFHDLTNITKDFNDHDVLTTWNPYTICTQHGFKCHQCEASTQAQPIQHNSAKLGWGCTTPNFARFIVWRRGIEIQPPGSA